MVAWRVLQLADAAFPTGGYVHSGGLEAMVQAGPVDLRAFCRDAIAQAAHGGLPVVGAAWDRPEELVAIDAFVRATLWSHVAARASKAQGWALLDIARRAFGIGAPAGVEHVAPAWGYVTRRLGIARDEALQTWLHVSLRGVLSAAVRLGVAGPAEAQALHHDLEGELDAGLALGRTLMLDEAAQPAPLVELHQARHDLLYSRLFQS